MGGESAEQERVVSARHLSRTNVSRPFPSENRDLGEPTIHVFLYDNLRQLSSHFKERLTCRTGAILSCLLGQRGQAHGWVWSVRRATEGWPE